MQSFNGAEYEWIKLRARNMHSFLILHYVANQNGLSFVNGIDDDGIEE